MAFDLQNPIGTGSDAELLEFWRAHLASLPLMGQEREIRGRKVKLPGAEETLAIIEQLESRINAAASSTANKCNYVSRQRPL